MSETLSYIVEKIRQRPILGVFLVIIIVIASVFTVGLVLGVVWVAILIFKPKKKRFEEIPNDPFDKYTTKIYPYPELYSVDEYEKIFNNYIEMTNLANKEEDKEKKKELIDTRNGRYGMFMIILFNKIIKIYTEEPHIGKLDSIKRYIDFIKKYQDNVEFDQNNYIKMILKFKEPITNVNIDNKKIKENMKILIDTMSQP